MWVIRYLNGPLAGQIAELKKGSNTVGRVQHCDVVVPHSGISKNHCKIDVLENEILITDLDSRNGTFVNGSKIKSHRIMPGDKISLYDVVLEVLELQDNNLQFHPQFYGQQQPTPQMDQNLAMDMNQMPDYAPNPNMDPTSSKSQATGNKGIMDWIQSYIDNVMLPGVYKLAEWVEFKNVLLMFMAVFIVSVTSLSTIPLMRILKSSIEKESQRRALTIARVLSSINRPLLIKGSEAAVSTDFARSEAGVKKAYILSNVDGRIIAPSSLAGEFSKDKFVHTARKSGNEEVGQIDSNTIGAVVPISYYNPSTGSLSVMAHSVIIYDMGTLAIDDGRTLSLFVQTLFIALILGSILFFFLFKLIQYPYAQITRQMDGVLRDGHGQLALEFKLPEVQTLISNITSVIGRLNDPSAGMDAGGGGSQDRSHEMANIIQLIGFPALAIQALDRSIAAINPAFEEKTGIQSNNLLYGQVESITDQSLKLSVEDLLIRCESQPDVIATNPLEFNGINHEIVAQAVFGKENIEYFVIVILPAEEEGGFE